ncbi:MAG: S9 family peptidase [Burkholderiales bacterium]|nr:prolyl oligopeptidase family serine peptidase [Burkholderiales bacterium]MDE1929148.1 S9 family peptidase [Burkholderiales bacterium]MDE2159432.1 S9 family peptidase [Burkholderiales bacterium]MDE2505448.1 S9 family peptidase [Burkholderiales bacterium]
MSPTLPRAAAPPAALTELKAPLTLLTLLMLLTLVALTAAPASAETRTETENATAPAPAPAPSPAAAAAALYARAPHITQASISPDGRRLAMLVPQGNGRQALVVQALPIEAAARLVAGFRDIDIRWFRWVNERRLIYGASAPGAYLSGSERGIFAVDSDGKDDRQLVAWVDGINDIGTRIKTRMLDYRWNLLETFDDGSDEVVMAQTTRTETGEPVDTQLLRLDTRTGATKSIGIGVPSAAVAWVFDAAGELRVVATRRLGRLQLYWREGAHANWVRIEDHGAFAADALYPLYLEADGRLIVRARAGADTFGLHRYDLKQRRLDPEPLVQAARYDIGSPIVDDRAHAVVGARLDADRINTVWFSARMAALQKAIDAALPAGRTNRISCARCATSANYLVDSGSDRQPGEYYVYEPARQTLAAVGATRPWIDESSQARRSWHWIQARDGLPLPLVVTHPPGHAHAALPAVVLVHGGPWVRGVDLGWEAEAQFLAARGYRVIEPEFRGSDGLGARHFEAGLKQWGRTMEDDLADAVAWAAGQGLIDPKRVCIVGSSYGGYAALMGPVRDPGVYRCAASFAGITDLRLMFSRWIISDSAAEGREYALPALIGDPQRDAALLARASPIERVAEIKVPLLLAQGRLDLRVPPEHASRFVAAARAAGVAVESVTYDDEGHGWSFEANHADYLARLDAFLARSLAP